MLSAPPVGPIRVIASAQVAVAGEGSNAPGESRSLWMACTFIPIQAHAGLPKQRVGRPTQLPHQRTQRPLLDQPAPAPGSHSPPARCISGSRSCGRRTATRAPSVLNSAGRMRAGGRPVVHRSVRHAALSRARTPLLPGGIYSASFTSHTTSARQAMIGRSPITYAMRGAYRGGWLHSGHSSSGKGRMRKIIPMTRPASTAA
jgi:hypothetical protein